MKCPYEQIGKNNEAYCWYEKHEGSTCEFVHREFGCPIARHYNANKHLIELIGETRSFILPFEEPTKPQFIREGRLW